jgi:RNA polymerase sigma-70 factor (ECF subfamily)
VKVMDPLARQAFADWTRAQPAVSAFVHALVADRADRDDVLQDVAVAVLEAYGSYDPARPFLPWALGIARHAAADSLRRRRRQPLSLAPEATEAFAAAVAEVAEVEQARLSHLGECMKELDGRAREACELRYRAGLAPARVAQVLGIQANTASKLLQRVREQLRECIERRVRVEARA